MDPASSIGQYQILRELKHRTSNKYNTSHSDYMWH